MFRHLTWWYYQHHSSILVHIVLSDFSDRFDVKLLVLLSASTCQYEHYLSTIWSSHWDEDFLLWMFHVLHWQLLQLTRVVFSTHYCHLKEPWPSSSYAHILLQRDFEAQPYWSDYPHWISWWVRWIYSWCFHTSWFARSIFIHISSQHCFFHARGKQ